MSKIKTFLVAQKIYEIYTFVFYLYMIVYLVSFATSRAAVERAGLQYVPFTQPSPTK